VKIKAILFDMDGVLIEAKEWHYAALNKALALFGMSISRYDHISTYDGLPTKAKLKMLSIERGLPVQLHAFIDKMKQLYTMEIVHSECKPRFVHEYALSRLKADGYKLAVCSNSIRNTVEVMMDKAALRQYLDLLISNQDVTKGKPDPEMYIKAMDKIGLAPQECLIVEDNQNGIKAAKASGAHLLVVQDVNDTNYSNIINKIASIEGAADVN